MAHAKMGHAPHLPSELLWVPERLDQRSAWLGHIPFAFWLVGALKPRVLVELGTHWGHSYFAFCQAIRDFGLATRAFAVDTWSGDEHSGFYGDEVFIDVETWNKQRFVSFSTLLRSTFDAAVGEFEPSMIDLLHIDGFHTYAAVKHDFETWLPHMSSRGVVLLHDITETRDDFGVHVLWGELAASYPTITFEHSHGLGVVFVGEEIPAAARELLHESSTRNFSDVLQALGERLELMARSQSHSGTISDLQVENEHRLQVINELQAENEHRLQVINELQAENEHRLQVINELTAETDHRIRVVEDLIEIGSTLDTEIEQLRSTVQRAHQALEAESAARLELEEKIRASWLASLALRRQLPDQHA